MSARAAPETGIAWDPAWYVYAVMPEGQAAPPGCGVAEAGMVVVPQSGLSALASVVPRALFAADAAESRTGDPDWIAVCATRHHDVVERAMVSGPCLPFGFGTLFASTERLKIFLATRASALREALARVESCREWAVTLLEDAAAHAAWLRAHDPGLRDLAARAEAAGPGTGFLLGRRLETALGHARAAHAAAAAARVGAMLAAAPARLQTEERGNGAPGWSLLVRAEDSLGPTLEAIAAQLDGTGLSLRVTGPWPPYGFARAALQEESHV